METFTCAQLVGDLFSFDLAERYGLPKLANEYLNSIAMRIGHEDFGHSQGTRAWLATAQPLPF